MSEGVNSPMRYITPSRWVDTDYKIRRVQMRVDDLKARERGWFERKIKISEPVKETNEAGGVSGLDVHCQVAGIVPALYDHQPATNAYGKLRFMRDDEPERLTPWFVRIAVNTPMDLIQELLESKFEVMSSNSHPIRIHCIDYNMWPEDEEPPVCPPVQLLVTVKLRRDLSSMCKNTVGIVLTWSGLAGNNIMHQVLGHIMEESRHTPRHTFNLASIATPPWNAVDDNLRLLMEKAKVG